MEKNDNYHIKSCLKVLKICIFYFSEIRSKHSNQTCLTVSMPNNEPFSEDEEGRPLTFAGCPVTLQTRKTNRYGKAHQRWHYDAETGFIHAFYADPYDKGLSLFFINRI